MEKSLRALLEEDEKLLWFGCPEPFETMDKTNKKSIFIGLVIKALVIVGCLALYIQSARSTGEVLPMKRVLKTLLNPALLVLIVAAAILISILLSRVNNDNNPFAMAVFILAVALVARTTDGYLWGILASLAGTFCVNYIFTYPFWAFDITYPGYPLTMAVMLVVSILISTLTTQIKHQEKIVRAHGGELTVGRSAHGGAALHLHRGGRGLPHGRRGPQAGRREKQLTSPRLSRYALSKESTLEDIDMDERTTALLREFHTLFGERQARVWSAPGRTEIGGNHTDHQLGKVVAASVDMDMLAAAAANGTNTVNVKSEGYDMIRFTLDTLAPVKGEEGTTLALVRGICAEAAARGFSVGGFDACITSNVLQGSGLSSSAAFEVLIGAVVNGLFCGSSLTAKDLAIMGQRAENVFFGKPCGLMDQMASAWGGIIAIDFADPADPAVTPVDFDFAAAHHSLCMINLHSDHADLTAEYAAIPGELRAVSAHFGKKVLREVDEGAFYAAIPALREELGDRAVLRAMHIYNDNRRVEQIVDALRGGDFDRFLALVRESGRSSWVYLQNVTVCGNARDQAAAVALALCERALGGRGAFRIHGGGFGGTVQAFVPDDLLESFRAQIEAVFGEGSCHVMHIRPVGFCEIPLD